MTRSVKAIRGMNDILPEETYKWEFFEQTVHEWLAAYGYRNIRTPIVEQTDLFVRSIGAVTDIVEKEMYTFVDHLNGDSLTLRPEGTASCVRAVLEHNLLYASPQRLYYSGPMFRHERPQKGRYRQFHQVGVEALGYAGPDIDAEHIVMCARLWSKLGISGVRLEIGTLGSIESRALHRTRLIKYFEQYLDKLDADARRRLYSNPLRILDSKNPEMREIIAAAPRLIDDLDEDSLLHFETLQHILRKQNINFEINPQLVRGLDYYNRTVFEWVTDKLGAQGTVCAGGRYDGLIAQIGGKSAPACGFAMGVERLLALMLEYGSEITQSVPHVYIVYQGKAAGDLAWKAAEYLRDEGLKTILHCGGGSFKAQMKKADASGARFALIIGDDEVQAEEVSLKPLRDAAEQTRVELRTAVDLIKKQY
ncbi:histidyl-tRNA synthetase [Nitrosomonas cryotolerans]|uniref:Histidine--tRNA ligase n=1 Tax=Nitrosomonas cryotolerans ATCC 49181 TaxID=1131553 RepID=A0A1N6IT91_9PROT|nr:histidine--tRNA ligase [Nitrosomonas cryotolerans]SFP32866.1 histidyl-tRNA synthetase [Nitrosomonas cryotolerans]SIO35241.1 histidyl-tRNA synthetase [Nitrosomonas cryotolerans ATCC 49181]